MTYDHLDPAPRFWVDSDPLVRPFQSGSFGVVDERAGGVIAYFMDEEDADAFVKMKANNNA